MLSVCSDAPSRRPHLIFFFSPPFRSAGLHYEPEMNTGTPDQPTVRAAIHRVAAVPREITDGFMAPPGKDGEHGVKNGAEKALSWRPFPALGGNSVPVPPGPGRCRRAALRGGRDGSDSARQRRGGGRGGGEGKSPGSPDPSPERKHRVSHRDPPPERGHRVSHRDPPPALGSAAPAPLPSQRGSGGGRGMAGLGLRPAGLCSKPRLCSGAGGVRRPRCPRV